jgi:hypothetical protein
MRARRRPLGSSPATPPWKRSAPGWGSTPATDLGAVAVAAYAERQGVDVESFLQGAGPALTAEQVGKSVLEIATGDAAEDGAYLLSSTGLTPLS